MYNHLPFGFFQRVLDGEGEPRGVSAGPLAPLFRVAGFRDGALTHLATKTGLVENTLHTQGATSRKILHKLRQNGTSDNVIVCSDPSIERREAFSVCGACMTHAIPPLPV